MTKTENELEKQHDEVEMTNISPRSFEILCCVHIPFTSTEMNTNKAQTPQETEASRQK